MEEYKRIKKIIIISPHFPPSNLTAVHRARFFAQHLPSFGWEPTIVTVHEDYYEEALDNNLAKLVPNWLRVEKVKGIKVTKPRLIGDIGLRSFLSLYRRAKKNNKRRKYRFCVHHHTFFLRRFVGQVVARKYRCGLWYRLY